VKKKMDNFEPNIIGFLCNWCSYAGADLAGTSRMKYPPNIKSIRVMCSGRVDPVFVLEALKKGADGVLVAGCHPGDCHYQSGNYKANRRMKLLKKLLDELSINPKRVRFEYISASEGAKFASVATEFVDELKKMGPNPLKDVKE
jgi:F420-non-reducing hydrogenase iron-sulfur subunit